MRRGRGRSSGSRRRSTLARVADSASCESSVAVLVVIGCGVLQQQTRSVARTGRLASERERLTSLCPNQRRRRRPTLLLFGRRRRPVQPRYDIAHTLSPPPQTTPVDDDQVLVSSIRRPPLASLPSTHPHTRSVGVLLHRTASHTLTGTFCIPCTHPHARQTPITPVRVPHSLALTPSPRSPTTDSARSHARCLHPSK